MGAQEVIVKTEVLSRCPQCGIEVARRWRNGQDLLLGVSSLPFPYLRCVKCQVAFLSNRPTPDSMVLFYPKSYHPYSDPSVPKGHPVQASFLERILYALENRWLRALRQYLTASIERRFPNKVVPAMQAFYRPARNMAVMLDFGCGSPWFLNRLRKKKWVTIGMDFKEDVVAEVRREGHRGILVSDHGWDDIEDNSLDAVRANHVLEHLAEPKAVLIRLLCKLKPGGSIHIAVPNPDGLSARLFRSRWFSLEAPRHLMMYSPEGLRKLLTQLGFTKVQVLQETTTKDFVRSLGYVLRDRRLLDREGVLLMADEPLLNAWLLPIMSVVTRIGYGDRIHIFAKKAADPTSELTPPWPQHLAGSYRYRCL